MNVSTGDVIAFAALLLSIWSMKRTRDFNRRQDEFAETADRLNKLLIEKESAESESSKKADVSANFINVGKSNYRLKVFNRGRGTARNVRIEVFDGEALLPRQELDRKFPIPILDQHQAVEVLVSVHMQSPDRAHIKLIWDDDVSKDNEKELTPSVF